MEETPVPYTGHFKRSFTTLKAYMEFSRGHVQCLELSKCSKTQSFTWSSYGSMVLSLVMQGVSKKRFTMLYSKCAVCYENVYI
jgi:hypothetical protein